jgi:hypothetical protein
MGLTLYAKKTDDHFAPRSLQRAFREHFLIEAQGESRIVCARWGRVSVNHWWAFEPWTR